MIVAVSCSSELSSWLKQAETYGQDGNIERAELEALIKLIDTEQEEYHRFLNEVGEVDTTQVGVYLERYLSKRLKTNDVNVWGPQRIATMPKFNVNVYVENSASMDGYVKGVTDFETAMYNLLADIKLGNFCDSLNLNYINSTVIENSVNALPPDIEDFISKLEPTDFKTRGGQRGTTDIKEILRDVLGRVNDRNMALLISDFVFSPGKNKDATEYLEQQQVGIRIDIAQKLDSFNLAIAVVQLESQFNGVYYDRNNSSIPIVDRRPYYVWFVGSEEQIREVLHSGIIERLESRRGYKNIALFRKTGKDIVSAHRVQHAKWKEGTFDREVSNGITGAEWDKETRYFGFSVAADLSDAWQGNSYIVDTSNYRVKNPRYGIRGVRTIAKDDPLRDRYTHLLEVRTVGTEPLRPDETVRVELLARMPPWVMDHSSLEDSRITDDPLEMGKTFGLKYLIEGVHGAYYPTPNTPLTTITIPIKKK